MKKLVLMVVASLACGVVLAQDELGGACANEGAFSSSFSTSGASVDTLRCTGGKWGQFKKGGKTQVLISYEVSDGATKLYSGSLRTHDGQPATLSEITETPYDASAAKYLDGQIVTTKAMVKTGRTMLFAPLLAEGGAVAMHIQFSESYLDAMEHASVGDLKIEKPVVSKVGTTHVVAMKFGEELVIPLQGVAANGSTKYTLRLVATAI